MISKPSLEKTDETKEKKKSHDYRKIASQVVSPYKEMFSWFNSFTINFIKKDASSSFSSSTSMQSIFALIDNLAPRKVERNVRDKAGPFFNQGNEIGVLLTHGFSSTAQEMQELSHLLNEENGYTTFAVLLAGHGTSPGDLAQTDMIDWYKSFKEGFDLLKQTCSKIILVGHSMGATLSLLLAANEPVDAIVTMCAPVKVEYFMQDYLFLIADLLKYFPRRKEEVALMDKHKMLNYRVSSLKAVDNLLELMEIARDEIHKVTAPILTITAGKDKRVPLYNAEKIRSQVNSKIKEDFFAPESHHTVLFGPEKQQVMREIQRFIKTVI